MKKHKTVKPDIKVESVKPIKLDVGCGTKKRDGFVGIDHVKFPCVDIQHDLNVYPWPLKDNSVEEVNCSHVLEHFDHNRHNPERVRLMNELHRVMIPGAKGLIITPHWCSTRAYGDFTHADKPVCEMFYFYLSKKWRMAQAPETDIEWNKNGYSCDFDATWGYSMREDLHMRNQEYQQFALSNFKEAIYDLMATITCVK